jgi:hypothetical protein
MARSRWSPPPAHRHLVQVKSRADSKAPWDHDKAIRTLAAAAVAGK